jgi:tRNA-Thr(GGU) m(6)t(6)A37 methyltransferase TsaA
VLTELTMTREQKGSEEEIRYRPIGIIHTGFRDKQEAPIQGVFGREAKGEVEVFPEFAAGLKDIEHFSHLILIYHFHRAEGYDLITKPLLEDEERGIFSVRHFKRPNPIGFSVVKLERVQGNVLTVSEVDILDGTPLLDIKPLVPLFDHRADATDGWLGNPRLDMSKGKAGRHRRE